jgi:GNAT superfamily N-acetyltransferase
MRISLGDEALRPASSVDIPELAALARAELPEMTALHEEESWRTHDRFGDGTRVRGNCTLVLRQSGQNGALVGFVWADMAMRTDFAIEEPWWCINALAVVPAYRGLGLGAALVSSVETAARLAGVVLVYGQSVPEAVDFWRQNDYILAQPGECLKTHKPARRAGSDPVMLTARPGPHDRWFVKYLAETPGSVQCGLLPESMLP